MAGAVVLFNVVSRSPQNKGADESVIQASKSSEEEPISVDSFAKCVSAGYIIENSFPKTCTTPEGTVYYESVVTGEVQGAADNQEAVSYCVDNGGEVRETIGDSGEVTYCVFMDGSMCEVSSFLRGDCGYGGYQ